MAAVELIGGCAHALGHGAFQIGMNGVLAIQAALISDHLKAIKFPSGHWLMEEKPAETSAALKDFFGN